MRPKSDFQLERVGEYPIAWLKRSDRAVCVSRLNADLSPSDELPQGAGVLLPKEWLVYRYKLKRSEPRIT
jgi:hypothetical protein